MLSPASSTGSRCFTVKKLAAVLRILDRVYEAVCTGAMALLAIMVVVTIVLRFVFRLTFVWSDEASLFVFVVAAFLGVIIGLNEDEHIVMGLLKDSLSETGKKVLQVGINLAVAFLFVVVFYASVNWISKVGYQKHPIFTTVSLRWFYIVIPITCILAVLTSIRRLIGELLPDGGGDSSDEQ